MDDDVKQNAEQTLNEIGLSMSTAINIFLKTVVRENRVPFELSADPFYGKENTEELKRRAENVRTGKSVEESLYFFLFWKAVPECHQKRRN